MSHRSEHDDHFSTTSKGVRLTRRQGFGAVGAAGVAYAITTGPLALLGTKTEAAGAASCVLTPAKTEGPYFVDELLERADIRSDSDGTNQQAGVKLDLALTVVNGDDDCSIGEGVVVDLWHANASGNYSDIAASSQDDTLGHDYLRGYQVTDAGGQVKFTTIYPGWYEGRTVHVHFKVRAFDGASTTYEFTSQLFFEQSTNNTVETSSGYEGTKSVTNSNDSIYGNDTEVLVPLSGSVAKGYTGEITIGLTGLPASSDAPGGGDSDDGDGSGTGTDEVEARLLSAKVERDRHGRRTLVAKLKADERASVKLRLIRGGKAVARGSGVIRKGKHELRMRVPSRIGAGPASLKAVLEDRAGNVKTNKRKVRIPR